MSRGLLVQVSPISTGLFIHLSLRPLLRLADAPSRHAPPRLLSPPRPTCSSLPTARPAQLPALIVESHLHHDFVVRATHRYALLSMSVPLQYSLFASLPLGHSRLTLPVLALSPHLPPSSRVAYATISWSWLQYTQHPRISIP